MQPRSTIRNEHKEGISAQYVKSRAPRVAGLLSSALPAFPEAGNATVSGTLRDPSKAMIPGTAVMLANTTANVAREAKTNEVGFYLLPAVQPGQCRLSVVRRQCNRAMRKARQSVREEEDPSVDAR